MTTCLLCGESNITKDHEKSEQHQRAGASLAVSIAERGFCPYCRPTKSDGLTGLLECRDKVHLKNLEECRRLLGDHDKSSR